MAEYCRVKGCIPARFMLWRDAVYPFCKMSWTAFRYHWRKLEGWGLVRIERRTGAVQFKDAEIFIPTDA